MNLNKQNLISIGYKFDEDKKISDDTYIGGFMFKDNSHYIDVWDTNEVVLHTGNYYLKRKVYSVEDLILLIADIASGRVQMKKIQVNSEFIARKFKENFSEN